MLRKALTDRPKLFWVGLEDLLHALPGIEPIDLTNPI